MINEDEATAKDEEAVEECASRPRLVGRQPASSSAVASRRGWLGRDVFGVSLMNFETSCHRHGEAEGK